MSSVYHVGCVIYGTSSTGDALASIPCQLAVEIVEGSVNKLRKVNRLPWASKGEVAIKNLPIGQYDISELHPWSETRMELIFYKEREVAK